MNDNTPNKNPKNRQQIPPVKRDPGRAPDQRNIKRFNAIQEQPVRADHTQIPPRPSAPGIKRNADVNAPAKPQQKKAKKSAVVILTIILLISVLLNLGLGFVVYSMLKKPSNDDSGEKTKQEWQGGDVRTDLKTAEERFVFTDPSTGENKTLIEEYYLDESGNKVSLKGRYLVLTEADGSEKKIPLYEGGQSGDTGFDFTVTNEDEFNFLIVGKDRVARNTDTIMLAHLNVREQSLTILQIPRDTYVELKGTDSYKVNSLFNHFCNEAQSKGESDVEKYGMEQFVSLLENNLCLNINFYAVVELDAFSKLVDKIGGVEFNVPFNMDYDDPEQDLHIHLKAGYQTLYGKQAEQFIRFRQGNPTGYNLDYIEGDLGRQNAQKNFMTALFKKVRTSLSVSTAATLAEIAINDITTDVSVSNGIYFAKELLSIAPSEIRFLEFPGHDAWSEGEFAKGASYYVMHRENMRNIINRFFNLYSSEITDDMFDRNRIFTSPVKMPHLHKIYMTTTQTDGKEYKASDLEQNPINIPTW